MIIVLGRMEVDPARRDELIAAQTGEAAASRAESGCVEWTMLVDPEREDVVRLLEVWADDASFELHLSALAERMAAHPPSASLAEIVRGVELTRYDTTASTPMGVVAKPA